MTLRIMKRCATECKRRATERLLFIQYLQKLIDGALDCAVLLRYKRPAGMGKNAYPIKIIVVLGVGLSILAVDSSAEIQTPRFVAAPDCAIISPQQDLSTRGIVVAHLASEMCSKPYSPNVWPARYDGIQKSEKKPTDPLTPEQVQRCSDLLKAPASRSMFIGIPNETEIAYQSMRLQKAGVFSSNMTATEIDREVENVRAVSRSKFVPDAAKRGIVTNAALTAPKPLLDRMPPELLAVSARHLAVGQSEPICRSREDTEKLIQAAQEKMRKLILQKKSPKEIAKELSHDPNLAVIAANRLAAHDPSSEVKDGAGQVRGELIAMNPALKKCTEEWNSCPLQGDDCEDGKCSRSERPPRRTI